MASNLEFAHAPTETSVFGLSALCSLRCTSRGYLRSCGSGFARPQLQTVFESLARGLIPLLENTFGRCGGGIGGAGRIFWEGRESYLPRSTSHSLIQRSDT